METKVNYTLVGFFVLVLGGVLIGVVFWLSSGGFYHRDYQKYLAYFDESVTGLSPNSSVRFRGVEVGRVVAITLSPDFSGRVRVLMKIDRTTPIKEDTLATLKMQGLTGLAAVELSGGVAASKPLARRTGEAYPVIKTKYSLMQQLDASVNGLLANLTQTSENINALTDVEMRQSIKRMIVNLEGVTQMLAAQKPALERVLTNAQRTFESSGKAADEVGKLAKRLNQTAQMVEDMTTRVSAASRSVRVTAEEARRPLRDLSGQTLPELNALAAEMRELAATMKHVGNDLEQNPEVLIYGHGAPKPGPGE